MQEIIEKEGMLNVKLSNDIMFKTLFTRQAEVFLQILKDVLNIKGEVLLSIVGYETVLKRTKRSFLKCNKKVKQ